ncbi:Rpn family recombination-promoting nuclease/putative transposase [Candidatus Tisiphia endosymbiont of Nedyus quadrimaculatus]|uniref:Rpn family recombination-promoting nuclease/putative transposase n=1 Tax=Candidatus Tisiphia endosymbiont of Nedyus quadrimaculatus TaxID=3139332 RepID=UPI00345EBAC8
MAISRFLDPKNDFCFKQIFGTEKNKDILIHFLNDILGYQGKDQIIEVSFLKTIQDPAIAAYRQSIVDVLCKDQNGTQVIVEMQVSEHAGFEKRAQYYAAKAYSQQILKEDENHKKLAVYAKLKGVIFLAIADFIMFPDKKDWKSTHRMLDSKTHEHDLKDFYFIFAELKKFHKTIDQLENIEEKWMYFFKHAHHSTLAEMEHLIGHDIIIKRAFQAIDQASWTEAELNTYDKITKTQLDNLAVEQFKIAQAEKAAEARGREEERKISETKLKEERITIARKLLKENMTSEHIANITGLSIEEINKLLK